MVQSSIYLMDMYDVGLIFIVGEFVSDWIGVSSWLRSGPESGHSKGTQEATK